MASEVGSQIEKGKGSYVLFFICNAMRGTQNLPGRELHLNIEVAVTKPFALDNAHRKMWLTGLLLGSVARDLIFSCHFFDPLEKEFQNYGATHQEGCCAIFC